MTSGIDDVCARIEADIGAAGLEPGARLGSEREMATRYGVGRSTVRRALARMEAAGRIDRVVGRAGGIFLSEPKVERELSGVVGVPEFLARQGIRAGSQILGTEIGQPSARAARELGLGEDELVVAIRRVRLADGSPLSLEEVQLPAHRFPGLLGKPLGGSIYELLRDDYGVTPVAADEQIEATAATEAEARLMDVDAGSPLLLVTRTTRDSAGEPFEFSRDLFRGDRTRLRITARAHDPAAGSSTVELRPAGPAPQHRWI